MAAKIDFFINNDNLAINTSKDQNYGIGQYFYVKADGSNGSDTDFTNSDCMKLTISRIHYKKTIYKPGFVNVEMTIDNFNNYVASNKKYVDALKVYFLSGQRTLSLEDETNKYIEGYYITDIALKQKSKDGKNVVMVILKAYSPDYFLTLTKYSQVYRGKTLSEIISGTLSDTFNEDSKILKDRFKHDYLCHTKKNDTTELQQPYLVQYNETFHDFVVRTANRCGELFYYEDGKLILGVDESNINTTDKDIKVQPNAIENTLPEDMVFSSVPGSFVQDAKNTSKSYMLNSTKAMEMAGKGLYYNQNIENSDALITTSSDDNLTWDDLTKQHWMEIGNKILGASGAIDAVFGGANKFIDLSETALLLSKGVLLEDKKKITIQDCEFDLNNLYHTEVDGKLGTDSNEAKTFKEQYEEEHPEEFQETTLEETNPFDDANSLASQALATYIKNAKEAKRDHVETWKENYFNNNKKEFEYVVELTDDQIFAKDTEAGKAIEAYKNSTRPMTPEETRAFKLDYEKKHPDEFKDATNTDEIEDIWNDEKSNAHKAFAAANSIKPTDEEVKAKKEEYKKQHPDECKKTEYKDKDVVFNDPTSNMHRAFQNYMKSIGNTYAAIIKDEDNVKEQCPDYFKDKTGTDDELWAKILEDTECAPYKKLVENFKDDYKESHASEFQKETTRELSAAEKEEVWNDKEQNPYKDLDSYLSNRQGISTLSNIFYSWIEKIEKRSTSSIQVHKLSDSTHIPTYKLGQYYKISNSSEDSVYIINQVEVDIDAETASQDYKIDANISFSRTETNDARECETNKYQYKTFPPLADIPHIRKAEPQIAVVTDVADPQRAGRVQIRYPWMKKEDTPQKNKTNILNVKGKDASPQYSPWIPVIVPFAGGTESGFLMTPDKDDMVMINYEGGNIERPYVDGSLFCGGSHTYWGKTPLIPKANDFRSTKHVISYKGVGISFVPGSADAFTMGMLPGVFGPLFTALGNVDDKSDDTPQIQKDLKKTFNDNMKIGGGMVLSDYYGMYNISMSSATRSIDIESPWGNVNLNAFSGITISAPNGDIKIAGKNVTIEAGNNIKMISGKNIKSKKINWGQELLDGAAKSAGVAAGAFVKWAAKNTIGLDLGRALDLSFVRNVWEIICRPVEGSLSLNSKRNIMLEAGGGKVVTPADTLSSTAKAKSGFKMDTFAAFKKSIVNCIAPVSSAEADQNNTVEPMHKVQMLALHYFNSIDGFVEELTTSCNTFSNMLHELVNSNLLKKDQGHFKIKKEGYTDIDNLGKKISELEFLNFEAEKGKVEEWLTMPFARSEKMRKKNAEKIGPKYIKEFIDKYNKLVNLWANIRALVGFDGDGSRLVEKLKAHNIPSVKAFKAAYGFDKSVMDTKIPEAIATLDNIECALGLVKHSEQNVIEFISYSGLEPRKEEAKKLLKRLAYNIIVTESDRYTVWKKDELTGIESKDTKKVLAIKDLKDATMWKDYLSSIKLDAPSKINGNSVASNFIAGLGLGDLASYDDSSDTWTFAKSFQQTFNINGKSGPRSVWDVSSKRGVILMSGRENKTVCLGKNKGEFEKIENPIKTNDFLEAIKSL